MLLLASVFTPLKARIAALLMFSVSMILTYVWEKSLRPFDPSTKSFSDAFFEVVLLLIFMFAPMVGFVTGLSLLRRSTRNKV